MGIGKSASHTGCGLAAQVPIHSSARGCDWTNQYARERNGHNAPEDASSWLLQSMCGGRNLSEPFSCHLQPPCFGNQTTYFHRHEGEKVGNDEGNQGPSC